MRYQEATSVIPAPMGELERRLSDVGSWPGFLIGLEDVRTLGHERYLFGLVEGRRRREAVMCVRHAHAWHRFSWKSLEGPLYTGRLQLDPVDPRHCAVRLALASHPGTLAGGLAEMVLPGAGRAADDLRRLERYAGGTPRVPAPRAARPAGHAAPPG